MKTNIYSKLIILLFVCISSFSCSEDDSIFDCVASHNANIETNSLAQATLYSSYYQIVVAEVGNSTNDDDFIYNFSISGAVPNGISVNQSGRELIFSGTPTEYGSFDITINLTVENPSGNNRFCLGSQHTEKDFTLTVSSS